MKRAWSFLQVVAGLALLAAFALGLVAAFRVMSGGGAPGAQEVTQPPQGYPPPQATVALAPQTPYPTMIVVGGGELRPTPTFDPIMATERAVKEQYTPSAAEIEAAATSLAERATSEAIYSKVTPPPPPTPVYYPVKSVADILNVVFNDPFFREDNHDFSPCIKAAQPGNVLYVRDMDNLPGTGFYYLVPFFKDGKVCGKALVTVENGMGTAAAWSDGRGKQFPPVSAEEAKVLVEKKTGQKAVGEPQFVFQTLREGTDPFWPFWQVSIADGQTYYVAFVLGITELNVEELIINVWNAAEVHPIYP